MSAPGWSYRPAVTRVTGTISFVLAGLLLWNGWDQRDAYYLTPEEGLGYLLGIIGGSMMLLLALYPLRKHARWMRGLGAVRHWFRMHMVFGIAGPLAILYHCNFGLGATNSNVALMSMLIVAGSGLFGRYLYMRIHHGLYGAQIRVADLRRASAEAARELAVNVQPLDALSERLDSFEAPALAARRRLAGAALGALSAPWRRIWLGFRARRLLRDLPPDRRNESLRLLRRRLDAIVTLHRFNAFERLFSLWHLLHMPLFVLLVMTGVVHVVAVHLY